MTFAFDNATIFSGMRRWKTPRRKVWHDISIVDMEETREGIPRTAGAHAQCLLTSKELTKVKNELK